MYSQNQVRSLRRLYNRTLWSYIGIAALSVAATAFLVVGNMINNRQALHWVVAAWVGLALAAVEYVIERTLYKKGKKGAFILPAFMMGLLALYEVTGDQTLLDRVEDLCRRVLADFPDQSRGGFFLTSQDGEPLILRPKEAADGALPSGNTVMAWVLVRLAHLTDKEEWCQAAEAQLAFLAEQAARYPTAYPVYLLAALEWEQPPEEVTVAAPTREDLPKQPWPFPLDALVRLLDQPTQDHPLVNGQTTYYVCRDHACQPPRNLYS